MSCRDVGPSWLAACLGVVLLAGGCERPTTLVPVKGRVLLDGKPLPSGVVQFQPASGQSASGQIADDGSFVLSRNALGDGVPPGTYRVAVISYDPTATTDAVENLRVPVRYTRFGSSGIEFTVFPGAVDPLVIQLVSDAAGTASPASASPTAGEPDSNEARGASDTPAATGNANGA